MIIDYSVRFFKEAKKLRKKYPKIDQDIKTLVLKLKLGYPLGKRIEGLKGFNIYKTRIRNTSSNSGKSGGFRAIYYLQTEKEILMLSIYSKSQKENISKNEILEILREEEIS